MGNEECIDLNGRDHSEDLGLDEEIILEWILGNWDVKVLSGYIWLRIGSRAGRAQSV
jgi:hypothetical protein